MKIWIDLTNSPHVNFFKPFIRQWIKGGHEVILTARNLSNTVELIKQNNWEYSEVGGHAGKRKLYKVLYFPIRIKKLFFFLKRNKPDISISHSSFYSPIVSWLLGVPSIYLNDNEYAKGNYIAFKFASINLLPDCLMSKARRYNWTKKYPLKFYPGIKEAIYLSQNKTKINKMNSRLIKDKIYFRLEPWEAEYYSGDNTFLDSFIEKLASNFKVVILPRNKKQVEHFKQKNIFGLHVAEKPIELEEIITSSLIFVGAGGSMTRELALMGVPTISVYQDELLAVDQYLLDLGILNHSKNPSIKDIYDLINNARNKKNTDLIRKGEDAFNLVNSTIEYLIQNDKCKQF